MPKHVHFVQNYIPTKFQYITITKIWHHVAERVAYTRTLMCVRVIPREINGWPSQIPETWYIGSRCWPQQKFVVEVSWLRGYSVAIWPTLHHASAHFSWAIVWGCSIRIRLLFDVHKMCFLVRLWSNGEQSTQVLRPSGYLLIFYMLW